MEGHTTSSSEWAPMIKFPWSLDIFLLFMKSFAPLVRETGTCWLHLSTFVSGESPERSECRQGSLLTALRVVKGSAHHPHSEKRVKLRNKDLRVVNSSAMDHFPATNWGRPVCPRLYLECA